MEFTTGQRPYGPGGWHHLLLYPKETVTWTVDAPVRFPKGCTLYVNVDFNRTQTIS